MTRRRSDPRRPQYRPTVHDHIHHAHHCTRAVLVILFRVFVFAIFAPMAWHELQRGDIVAALVLLLVGLYLAALMAPFD